VNTAVVKQRATVPIPHETPHFHTMRDPGLCPAHTPHYLPHWPLTLDSGQATRGKLHSAWP